MKAVTIVDGELRWLDHPDPVPGHGEVLVDVRAAGVNGADLLQRRGLYPAPPGWPQDIPGMEVAGTVAGVGRGTGRFAEGDRVMGLCGGGAQAELVVVPESALMSVPVGLAWPQAGGFPEVACTAHDALMTRADLRAGERVLVTGAAGGVGTAAVQLARAAGAHVVASVRARELAGAVTDLGAAEVVAPDDAAHHGPYDVVLELVGAPSLAAVLPALATEARVIVIGVGAGAKLELNLLTLMGSRATVGGATLRSRTTAERAAVTRAAEAWMVPRLASGEVLVPVAATFPLEGATDAYERFSGGGKLGKVVLLAE
jgi:NADPH:quinone reductase